MALCDEIIALLVVTINRHKRANRQPLTFLISNL